MVDKIYLCIPTKIAIVDHEKKHTFENLSDGLPDVTKAMADFGDDDYKHMLCVEAAAIKKSITLDW
ncbi:hypothetical protein Hanom_Chr13g01199441 [Helianthus anomalus]